jgi:catechol 2,3-dioxygenase-like lactoylglutathione lyase family enzyme
MTLKDAHRPAVGRTSPLVTERDDTEGTRDSPAAASAEPGAVDLDSTARNGARPPRLRLASAVMFVRQLDRSVSFYRDLLAMDVRIHDHTAALLVSPDGFQLYLRSMGPGAQRPLGHVGIQYLTWTADSEEDLRRCARLLARSGHVTSQTVDGITVVEGRGPDGVPVVVAYPGPDQAPRHEIPPRIYEW